MPAGAALSSSSANTSPHQDRGAAPPRRETGPVALRPPRRRPRRHQLRRAPRIPARVDVTEARARERRRAPARRGRRIRRGDSRSGRAAVRHPRPSRGGRLRRAPRPPAAPGRRRHHRGDRAGADVGDVLTPLPAALTVRPPTVGPRAATGARVAPTAPVRRPGRAIGPCRRPPPPLGRTGGPAGRADCGGRPSAAGATPRAAPSGCAGAAAPTGRPSPAGRGPCRRRRRRRCPPPAPGPSAPARCRTHRLTWSRRVVLRSRVTLPELEHHAVEQELTVHVRRERVLRLRHDPQPPQQRQPVGRSGDALDHLAPIRVDERGPLVEASFTSSTSR